MPLVACLAVNVQALQYLTRDLIANGLDMDGWALFLHAVELEAAGYVFNWLNECFLTVLKAGGCIKQGSESAGTKEYVVHWGYSGFCRWCKTRQDPLSVTWEPISCTNVFLILFYPRAQECRSSDCPAIMGACSALLLCLNYCWKWKAILHVYLFMKTEVFEMGLEQLRV